MSGPTWSGRPDPASGTSVLAGAVVAAVLFGLFGGLTTLALASRRVHGDTEGAQRATLLAEAGISDKVSQMIAGDFADLGAPDDQAALSGGSYWVEVESLDPERDLYRLVSRGSYDGAAQAIESVVHPIVEGARPAVLFAGNRSEDPDYRLVLAGEGRGGDSVRGEVYCGGDLLVEGEAHVQGAVRATGSVRGAAGEEGAVRPLPDFASMPYDVRHDVDVAARFARGAVRRASPLGGTAWELPEGSPARFFRCNPSDRSDLSDRTPGDDYFLEGPDGTPAFESGDTGAPGERCGRIDVAGAGERALFLVRGNVWIQSRELEAFVLAGDRDRPVAVTIVARGNVYVAEDVRATAARGAALALIALEDPDVPGSGNVVIGDPDDGRVRRIDAFLFAENDVVVRDLDPTRSPSLTVRGTLTAGDHVVLGEGFHRPRLDIGPDERRVANRLRLPGEPDSAVRVLACSVLSWRKLGP